MKKIRFGILSTAGIAQKERIPAFKRATLAASAVGVSNEQSDFMLTNTKQKLTNLQLLFLNKKLAPHSPSKSPIWWGLGAKVFILYSSI